jgi:hypothetical protein
VQTSFDLFHHQLIGSSKDNTASFLVFEGIEENAIIISNGLFENFLGLAQPGGVEIFVTFQVGKGLNYSGSTAFRDFTQIGFRNTT